MAKVKLDFGKTYYGNFSRMSFVKGRGGYSLCGKGNYAILYTATYDVEELKKIVEQSKTPRGNEMYVRCLVSKLEGEVDEDGFPQFVLTPASKTGEVEGNSIFFKLSDFEDNIGKYILM